jgi:hypothetical protein
VLVECGFVRAQAADGTEYTFRPSLARVAALGPPESIVGLYADLHGPRAAQEAAYVLAGFCDQEDSTPLVGWFDADGWHDGAMPPEERVIVARHLMHHAICGRASPDASEPRDQGQFSTRFDAAEYIAVARVHLGMSAADAEALSMTELQALLDVKFPRKGGSASGERNVPTREEYEEAMRRFDEIATRSKATPTAGGVQ